MAGYSTVFLGFPIWGETAPPLIRSFLSSHDLSGKTLVPFITHGGYGLGNSEAVIAKHAPRALIRSPFVMQADPAELNNLGRSQPELVLAMNEKLNRLIEAEVGEDKGQMLPGGLDAGWEVSEETLRGA